MKQTTFDLDGVPPPAAADPAGEPSRGVSLRSSRRTILRQVHILVFWFGNVKRHSRTLYQGLFKSCERYKGHEKIKDVISKKATLCTCMKSCPKSRNLQTEKSKNSPFTNFIV